MAFGFCLMDLIFALVKTLEGMYSVWIWLTQIVVSHTLDEPFFKMSLLLTTTFLGDPSIEIWVMEECEAPRRL